MLLKWANIDDYSEEDAILFFNENEQEIMHIYSQYSSMFGDELSDGELSVMTITYLLFGTDEEVPNCRFTLNPEEIEYLEEKIESPNNFVSELSQLIQTGSALYDMVQSGLLQSTYDEDEGRFFFSMTKKGKEMAQDLDELEESELKELDKILDPHFPPYLH